MSVKISIYLVTGLLVVGSTISTVSPNDDASPLDAVSTVAPADVESVADVSVTDDGLVSRSNGVTLDVDIDPGVGITVGTGESEVGIGLPFADNANDGVSESPGSLTFDNNNGTSSVSLVREDGAVQVVTVIDSPDAPTTFAYAIDLPAGAKLVTTDDGAAVVDNRGESLGTFAAPWARDAAGTDVPTRYEVRGSTLTQVVEHDPSQVYPVVADPTYTTHTMYWSKSDVRGMYQGVVNVNNICNWLPLPYLAGVGCGAVPTFASAITQAYHQGKRVKAVYYNCGFNYCSYYRYYVVA